MARKTEQVNLRMDSRLKQLAEKAAAEDHRPLSGLIHHLVAKHCKDRELSAEDSQLPKRGRK
jgi:hypothetical protein